MCEIASFDDTSGSSSVFFFFFQIPDFVLLFSYFNYALILHFSLLHAKLKEGKIKEQEKTEILTAQIYVNENEAVLSNTLILIH